EECRAAYADFIDLLHDKLPLAEPEIVGSSKLPNFFSESPSYRERFLARARKEGLAISSRPLQDRSKFAIWSWLRLGYAQMAAAALAALLVTVGLLDYNLHQSNIRYMKLASEKTALNTQSSQQSSAERLESNLPKESHVVTPPPLETPPAPAPTLP